MSKAARKKQQSAPRSHWEPTDRQAIAIFTLLTTVFFLDILMGKAYLWEDFVYQWYPFRQFAASSLARGELPLWNPFTFNGMPFLAEIQTEVFYLPMTLMTLFVSDGTLGVFWLEIVNILHYVLAAAGMFFLARSYNLKRVPALFAGITFGLSGFMVLHAIHQVITGVAAWFPLILWMFRKSLQDNQWRWVFLTSIALGHSFFAGSPQMSLFLYLFLGAFFVFTLLSSFPPRALLSRPALIMTAKAVAVVCLSLGISMIQFLPTREMSELSVRAQITFEKATEGSLAWEQLLTLVFPKFFGTSTATGYNYWGPGPYWHYWETCIYFGVLPLVLALLSMRLVRKEPAVGFFLGFALFSLLYALGGNFILQRVFFEFVPGFASFRNPARMAVFLALSGSLLGAFSLQHLLYGPRDAALVRWFQKGTLAFFVVVVGWGLLTLTGMLDGTFQFLGKTSIAPQALKSLVLPLVLVATSCALLLLLVKNEPVSRWAVYAAPLILFVDLYTFGSAHNNSPANPAEHFRRADPIVRFLKQQSGIFRVNTRNPEGMIMDRNQGLVDELFTIEGYTPLVLQRVFPPAASLADQYDLLNIRYMTVTDTLQRSLSLRERIPYLQRARMVYSVTIARDGNDVETILKSPQFDIRTAAVLEEQPHISLPPLSSEPQWKAEITRYHNNTIDLTVETEREGLLVLSETYYPGWNATVDGQETPIYRANYNLRSLFIPPGKHTVTLQFQPASFARGAIITLATLVVCCAGIIVPSFRRRTARDQKPPAEARG